MKVDYTHQLHIAFEPDDPSKVALSYLAPGAPQWAALEPGDHPLPRSALMQALATALGLLPGQCVIVTMIDSGGGSHCYYGRPTTGLEALGAAEVLHTLAEAIKDNALTRMGAHLAAAGAEDDAEPGPPQ